MKIQAQFGLTVCFGLLSTLLFALIKMSVEFDISKAYLPLLAFPLNFLFITVTFPKKLKIPFGEIPAQEFRHKIGLFFPKNWIQNILLGIILGICTLSGMLIGSLLTNRYVFDSTTIAYDQILFSTVPGFWEEVFFRGIFMIIAIQYFNNIKKAAIFQCFIFGLLHFKGIEFWTMFDMISVFFIGVICTYVAFKTNSLIPGIVFHFLHDAFIFVVQVPDGLYIGNLENIYFYCGLWGMILIGCFIVKIASEKFGVRQTTTLYEVAKINEKIPISSENPST